MLSDTEIASLVTGSVGLFLVALDSTPAVRSIGSRFWKRPATRQHNGAGSRRPRYRDVDGEATKRSLAKFSDTWQRVVIAILSELGLLISLPPAIITTLNGGKDGYLVQFWLQVAVWVLLTVQAVAFFTEPLSTERFKLGYFSFWASIMTILMPCMEMGIAWYAGIDSKLTPASRWLVITQIALAAVRGTCCTLIPRRPDVFINGKVVDQEHTGSIYSRFTFSWVNDLMEYTARRKGVSIDTLPELPSSVRPGNLRERFERIRGTRRLWKALMIAHYRPILVQLVLTFISCFLSFGPQMALYGILKSLEARGAGPWDAVSSWLWVVALGSLMVLSSSIDSWLYWIIYSQIGVPINEELAAIVFAKAMRRKDVKEGKKSNKGDQSKPDLTTSLLGDTQETREEEDLEKSRQSVINYAAVDSKRIADFATYNYLIPSAILKLLLACVFLASLLGIWSLLAGLAVSAIVLPANAHLAKKYATSQDNLMKLRDLKIATVTEVLQGIRQIKFAALEKEWEDRISERRKNELASLWTSFLYSTALVSIWVLGPLMLSVASLTTYVFLNGELTASVAFTALSIFGSLELSMASLPDLLSKVLEAKISCDRIDKYLESSEKTSFALPGDHVAFEDASVAWPADDDAGLNDRDRFVLRDLNLEFPSGGLSVISGRTGSGKSLLLTAILGECDVLGGTIRVPAPSPSEYESDDMITNANWIIDSAVAYVAQIPWIENATIKDNILFGLPFNPARYCKVLYASGLEKDLDMFPDGELTDIGANGVNLSGGQRWRISFARALYSRAGILVMDDIFSALDAQTGRHVYEHALTGEICQKRTRILATHHVSLCLPQTNYSVMLEDGHVKYSGTIEELRRTNSLEDIILEARIAELEGIVAREERVPDDDSSIASQSLHYTTNSKPPSIASKQNSITSKRSSIFSKRSSTFSKRSSTFSNRSYTISQGSSSFTSNAETLDDELRTKKFVQEEKRGTGSIPLHVYTTYLKKGGKAWIWTLVFLAYVAYAGLMVLRSWWVSVWTSSSGNQARTEDAFAIVDYMNRFITVQQNDPLPLYLGVYVGISLLTCLLGTIKYYMVMYVSIEASKNLSNDLMHRILRAPLRWLDTVPLGRILNRFTADVYMIDARLGYDIGFFVFKALEIIGILVAAAFVSPLIIVFALILLMLCLRLSMTYLTGAREVKRLESTAKSPIFEQFGSSLNGLITIRAFGKVDVYMNIMYTKINRHAQAAWNLWLFNRWLDFRMNLVGALFSTVTAALVVYVPSITASLAGFALSFALQYNSAVTMVLRQYASLELDMNATERVIEYSNIEIENHDGLDAPAAWPTEGEIEVEDLVVSYAQDLPPVLNGLSFTAEKNQRVGVVGRTGAGKSSLTLALYRFLEARGGHIWIDGIDVSKIKLHDLRSRLAIIPQDPVLFSGTIRSNLDPFDEHSDMELYDALGRVNLVSFEDTETLASDSTPGHITRTTTPISTAETIGSPAPGILKNNGTLFSCLCTPVSEGGLNFSQGQRQLLCLARAIVSRPKIMILDEATSAVDMETDAMIQRSIRAEFGRNASTLLVIAHRLSTIADFDRILVMDAGKAVEFGTPQELMDIEEGVFKNLVENSGERDVVEQMINGEISHV